MWIAFLKKQHSHGDNFFEKTPSTFEWRFFKKGRPHVNGVSLKNAVPMWMAYLWKSHPHVDGVSSKMVFLWKSHPHVDSVENKQKNINMRMAFFLKASTCGWWFFLFLNWKDIPKVNSFARSEFSLIIFCAKFCAKIAIKNLKDQTNLAKLCKKYAKMHVLQGPRLKVKILRRF